MISKLTKRASSAKTVSRGRPYRRCGCGGGLAVGVQVPGNGKALAQKVLGAEGNEVGAWVVIRANDDVIVRVRPLGNGSGHAHRSRAARVRRTAVRLEEGEGQNMCCRARASRAIVSGATCPPAVAAASARRMTTCARAAPRPRDADQGCGRRLEVPVEECTVETVSSRTPVETARPPMERFAQAAAKLDVPKEPKIRDPKDWKLIGKGVPRLRYGRQAQWQARLRHRRESAEHAARIDHGCPRVRRQAQERGRRQGEDHARREAYSAPWATVPLPSSPRRGGRRTRRSRK